MHAKAEQVLHGEEERCVDELQKTREAYKQRLSEDNELRVRLETEQGRTRDASSVPSVSASHRSRQARWKWSKRARRSCRPCRT